MKNIFRTRYRIVWLGHREYTSERKRWFDLSWELICIHMTVQSAEACIRREIERGKLYPKVIKEL